MKLMRSFFLLVFVVIVVVVVVCVVVVRRLYCMYCNIIDITIHNIKGAMICIIVKIVN